MQVIFLQRFLFQRFRETVFRFCVPVVCSLIFTLLLVLKINDVAFLSLNSADKVYFYHLLFCGFFAFTALRLFVENHSINQKQSAVLNSLLAFFLVYACFTLSVVSLAFLVSGFIIFLLIAPYIFNDMGEEACYYFIKIVTNIFFALLSAFILFVCLTLVFFSVDYLFHIKISHRIYTSMLVLVFCFFFPVYVLSGFSKKIQTEASEYPKGINFIFSYILSPLIVVYFVILYVYIAKILIEWELPRGKVASMVLVFGVVGILTHVFLYPLKDRGPRLIKLVYRYFYYALLAPTLLLFVGIGLRIKSHGVTEARYLVVLFATWFLLSSVYFIFTKSPKLKVIMIMIGLMLVGASFGVWGAESVSGRSQTVRLKILLEQNKLLID